MSDWYEAPQDAVRKPPSADGMRLGTIVAVVAHIGLIAALAYGVAWKRKEITTATAELWASVPQAAGPAAPPPAPAPKPVAPVVTPPVKAPPPPPAPPPAPAPKAREAPAPRDADIAQERAEKRRKEAEEAAALEKEKKARLKEAEKKEAARKKAIEEDEDRKLAAVQARLEAEKAEKADKLAQKNAEKEAALKKKEAERKAAEKAAEAEKLKEKELKAQQAKDELDQKERAAKARAENLKRMQKQLGDGDDDIAPASTGKASKSGGSGTAAQASGPSAGYSDRVQLYVRPKIIYSGNVADTGEAVVKVRLAPDGTIISRTLIQSSGNPAWDEAVLRALDRAGALPRDGNTAPPSFEIGFKPR